MRRRASLASILAILGVLLTGTVGAAAEDVYSERTLDIARELRCMVCDGESVAASQASLSVQMRATIEEKVQAGWTDQEIKDYFVDRYGEQILMEPPKEGLNLTLWWLPVVALGIGATVVVLYLRENTGVLRSAGQDSDEELDPELEQIARDALGPDSDSGGTDRS